MTPSSRGDAPTTKLAPRQRTTKPRVAVGTARDGEPIALKVADEPLDAQVDVGSSSSAFVPRAVMKAREQVEIQLRSAILGGTFQHGDRLPSENDLTEKFSVSRTTIREALRSLTEQGLIKRVPGANGGSFVQIVDHRALADQMLKPLNSTLQAGGITYEEVAQLRNALEIPVARLAAENRDVQKLAALKDVVELEKATTSDDPNIPELNAQFHIRLAEATGNRLLSAFVTILHRSTQPLSFIDTSPEVGRDSVKQHLALLACIAAQDADGAARVMNEHLGYLDNHHHPG